VAVLYKVLGHFALVDLLLFGQEIYGEFLLEQGGSLVLLVGQDALYRGGLPCLSACRGGDTGCRQVLGDMPGGLALEEHPIDQPPISDPHDREPGLVGQLICLGAD
jgi:hypothetical protein